MGVWAVPDAALPLAAQVTALILGEALPPNLAVTFAEFGEIERLTDI